MGEFALGNIYVRDNGGMHETGWVMGGHCHNFDHATFILQGVYKVTRMLPIVDAESKPILNNEVPTFTLIDELQHQAPKMLLIQANVMHKFECIEGPGQVWCLYSHRVPQAPYALIKTGWETGDENIKVSIGGPNGQIIERFFHATDPILEAVLTGKFNDPCIVQNQNGWLKAYR